MANALMMPDIAGAFAQGQVARALRQEGDERNALRAFLADNGGALMAGDQNALAAFAQYDPVGALGIQGKQQEMEQSRQRFGLLQRQTRQGMEIDAEMLTIAQAQGERAATEFGWQVDDRKRAEIAAKARSDAERAQIAWSGGAEEFDRWNDSHPEYANISFEDAPYKIAEALGAAAVLEAMKPVEPMSPEGKLAHDVEAGIVDPNADKPYDFGAEADLRKEFTGLGPVKSFQVQAESVGKVLAAAEDPSAAGDLALIFSFMKILDPNSVVREQEFANAQNAAGVPDMVRNAWNRALNGERLNPDQRQDFLRTAIATYRQAEEQVKQITDQYGGIADERGLARKRAIPNFGYAGAFPDLDAYDPTMQPSAGTTPAKPQRLRYNPETGELE